MKRQEGDLTPRSEPPFATKRKGGGEQSIIQGDTNVYLLAGENVRSD